MKFPYTSSSANICSSKTPCSNNPLFLRKFHLAPKYINLLRITRHRQKCVYKRLRYIVTTIRLIKLVRSFSFLFYLWNVLERIVSPHIFAYFTTASCIILTFTYGQFHTVIHAVNCRCKKNI